MLTGAGDGMEASTRRASAPAPSSRAARARPAWFRRLWTHFRGLGILEGEELGDASFEPKLLEPVRARGRGNFVNAEAAEEARSVLDEDLVMKLLRRPEMSRDVRLELFVIGKIKLEVDGLRPYCEVLDGSSLRLEKDADEIPPPCRVVLAATSRCCWKQHCALCRADP